MLDPIKHALEHPLMTAQTTVSGNNTDTFGRAFTNYGHKGLMGFISRTADGGTCTLDLYMQGLPPGLDEATDANWVDVSGILIPQYADGVTGRRSFTFYPGVTAQDGGIDAINTTMGHASGYLPLKYRLRLRSGGTSVTNTIEDIVGVPLL